MRRLVVLLGALVVLVIPAPPAFAATATYCVNVSAAGCVAKATIASALTAASSDNTDSEVLIGAGEYTEGPFYLTGDPDPLTVAGAGQGVTVLKPPGAPGGQVLLAIDSATVRDLTVVMPTTDPAGDQAVYASNGGVVDHVTVDGTGTANTLGVHLLGSTLSDSVVDLPKTGDTRAVYVEGGSLVADSTLTGSTGVGQSTDAAGVDALSRLTITPGFDGVVTDGGTIDVDDTVIDLGSSSGSGLLVANFNNSAVPKVVNADHLTIVGGGGGSEGVWAYAAAAGAKQAATVTLTNSIVRGPTTSVVAQAGNNGSQGGNSVATVTMSHTDYQVATVDQGANGTATVTQGGAGNVVDVDPGFVDAAAENYRLTAGSPVVDQGDPAAGGPTLDRDGEVRVVDGDSVPGARRDLGAYELGDTTPPDTTIATGPDGPTSESTPTFTFTSTEAGTFECQLDGTDSACTTPFTSPVLADGYHTLTVTAVDGTGNADPTPATRGFTVDTVAPDTTLLAGPTGLVADRTPTFAFSGEAGATFECRVDAGAYAACASPFTAAALGDGAHTFSVRAEDAAGNVDATPATRSLTVDGTRPATTVTKKPAKRVTTKKVRLVFSSEVGATFTCQVDGKAWRPCTSPLKVRLRLGKHTILVRAVDAAGNVEATPAKVKVRRVP